MCHAVFAGDLSAGYSPELFSRMPDGHVYLAGLNNASLALPRIANERNVKAKDIAALHDTARSLLGDDTQVVREGLCWRPITRKGSPILRRLDRRGLRNVIVAAGHGAWGISLSLGTGWCCARMIAGEDVQQYVQGLGL